MLSPVGKGSQQYAQATASPTFNSGRAVASPYAAPGQYSNGGGGGNAAGAAVTSPSIPTAPLSQSTALPASMPTSMPSSMAVGTPVSTPAASASTPATASSLSDLAAMFMSGTGASPITFSSTPGTITNPTRPSVAMPDYSSVNTSKNPAPTTTGSPALTDQLVAELARASGYYAVPTDYYLNDAGEIMANIGNDRLMGNAGQTWRNLGKPS